MSVWTKLLRYLRGVTADEVMRYDFVAYLV